MKGSFSHGTCLAGGLMVALGVQSFAQLAFLLPNLRRGVGFETVEPTRC